MRFGGTFVLAGVAMLSLPASAQVAPAPAESSHDSSVTHSCRAETNGPNGETVTVAINIDAASGNEAIMVWWRPPQAEERAINRDLARPDFDATIGFEGSTALSIGRPASAFLTISVFSPPRNRAKPADLTKRLGSLSGQYRFGDSAFVPMARFGPLYDLDLPGTARIGQSIDLPHTLPASLDVRVLDKHGKIANAARFVLSGLAARDALYAQAYAQAAEARADIKGCTPLID